MAQRMRIRGPRRRVMLSESTARLVADDAVLSEPKSCRSADHRAGTSAASCWPRGRHEQTRRRAAKLAGREWELTGADRDALTTVRRQPAESGIAGAPGIGKSRLPPNLAALAQCLRA